MADISRSEFIKKTVLASAGIGIAPNLFGETFSSPQPHHKKNVLFIVVDDLRPCLGSYGVRNILSPHIDQLSSEGTLFKRSFTQVPVCGASRVSFLTGIRVQSSAYNMQTSHIRKGHTFISIPEHFKSHGYYAVSLGKVFHVMHDRQQDWSEAPWRSEAIYYGKYDWAHYDTYNLWQNKNSAKYVNSKSGRGPYYESAKVSENSYQDGKLAEKAIHKLKELKNRNQPFFLALGFWRPHLPMNAPLKYWDLYERENISIADNRYRPEGLPREVKNSTEIARYGRILLIFTVRPGMPTTHVLVMSTGRSAGF